MNNHKITAAKWYATYLHNSTNHLYDGHPYTKHLELVVKYAEQFSYILTSIGMSEDDISDAIAAAWLHDAIEDCRVTYNDIKSEMGEPIAEIVYLLSNNKGRTREERADDTYYEGIKSNPIALYVKLCDRMANIVYSIDVAKNPRMLEVYKNEHHKFYLKLEYDDRYIDMWRIMEMLLKQPHIHIPDANSPFGRLI